MTKFRFRLEKVLQWRTTQLELEEARFKQQLAAIAALDHARAELQAIAIRTELEVRKWQSVSGRDLTALGGFRSRVRNQEREIGARRAQAQKALEAQESLLLEARRRCRLLERLKDRRHRGWNADCDRELEALAADSFLAGRNRRASDSVT